MSLLPSSSSVVSSGACFKVVLKQAVSNCGRDESGLLQGRIHWVGPYWPESRNAAAMCDAIRIACPQIASDAKRLFTTRRTQQYREHYGIVNYYAVVFLLRPPNLLRCEPFFERRVACKTKEMMCPHKGVAIANHCVIVNLLGIVNLPRRSIFSTAGSFG